MTKNGLNTIDDVPETYGWRAAVSKMLEAGNS